ncbi:MAG: hypothetical protein IPI60_13955 [Saprospiraceae bacterium]|nr:hypothetical protein [Saprospiraceae bacterium]
MAFLIVIRHMNRFLLYSSKYIFISALFLTSVISDAQTDREVGTGLDPIVTVGVQFNTILRVIYFGQEPQPEIPGTLLSISSLRMDIHLVHWQSCV